MLELLHKKVQTFFWSAGVDFVFFVSGLGSLIFVSTFLVSSF